MEPANSIPAQRVDGSPDRNIEPISEEYWDFEDVFSGGKANTLAPHHPYDLQIKLETGAKLTHGPNLLTVTPRIISPPGFH